MGLRRRYANGIELDSWANTPRNSDSCDAFPGNTHLESATFCAAAALEHFYRNRTSQSKPHNDTSRLGATVTLVPMVADDSRPLAHA